MNHRLVASMVVCAGVVGFALGKEQGTAPTTVQAAPPPRHVTAPGTDVTREVQQRLASFGYSIAVDGVYGPQTTRVVTSWQRSNGLVPDGIAGPITQASLGLAQRGPQIQLTVPPAPPTVEQLIRDVWPDHLEAEALRIAHRESRYQPGVTSPTGCCHGVFQLHEVHLSWMRAFGVTTVAQLFDADTNVRMALELYRRDGWQPWR